MEQQTTHRSKWYVVKKLKLLDWLCYTKHIFPHHRDISNNNPAHFWYYYENTPELEQCLDEWFSQYK